MKTDKFKKGQQVYANKGGAILSYIVQERTSRGYVIRRKGFDTLVFYRTQDANRCFSATREAAEQRDLSGADLTGAEITIANVTRKLAE